jgi:uncharacterized protein YndB with AHSA1/START domain
VHRNEHSIEIDAPADRVFEYVSRPDLMKEWVGGLVEFRLLDPGPALGARGVQIVEVSRRNWELQSEITRYQPPRALQARLTHKGFVSTAAYELEEHDGHTHVHATLDTEYKLFANRLLGALVTRQAQKKLEDDLERLKRAAESAG